MHLFLLLSAAIFLPNGEDKKLTYFEFTKLVTSVSCGGQREEKLSVSNLKAASNFSSFEKKKNPQKKQLKHMQLF